MIYEYALDPEVVATWSDPREYALFREGFSRDSGRVGSIFPRKWSRAVIKAFHSLPRDKRTEQAEARLMGLLSDFEHRMIERDSACPALESWLDKAECEHRKRPFHGILSRQSSTSGVAEVFTPDALASGQWPESWRLPSILPTRRTATELTEAVRPLLTKFRNIVLIDPWFTVDCNSDGRYIDTLQAMLTEIWSEDRCCADPIVELITAENSSRSGRGGPGLMSMFHRELPKVIPAGHELKVTILKERDSGERIHNRYILTELVGVSFGIGLDRAREDDPIATDDLCRLSSEQHRKRWGQYVSARSSWFDLAAGPDIIRSRSSDTQRHADRDLL